jgi:hypothetical protein
MIKLNTGQAQPVQLGFDFEFTQTVATIERIRVAADTDEEGESNADWKRSTADSRKARIEAGNTGSGMQNAVQPARGENPRPLGDELAEALESPGNGGRNGTPEPVAGTTEHRRRDSAGFDGVTPEWADGSRDTNDARDRDGVVTKDYVITEADRLGEGGAKTKYRDNVAALQVLKTLQKEVRPATLAEQSALVKYVGWGGIPQVFDHLISEWQKEFAELSVLLS